MLNGGHCFFNLLARQASGNQSTGRPIVQADTGLIKWAAGVHRRAPPKLDRPDRWRPVGRGNDRLRTDGPGAVA